MGCLFCYWCHFIFVLYRCKKDQLFMADHVTALLEAAAEEALQNSEIDVVPHATPTGSLSCILEAFPTFTQVHYLVISAFC